ncbi:MULTISPECIES: urease accessory protein UreD [unclassified Coleofasciculus]|uniref:urease accessory protein UreD n=1 Tax=unclassified Coleofasciculus TaxID=2692782 RepID=UPI00187EDCCE|nr:MULTISPECIES: urease accessory protein UreD [unclassified Coleofasciculus]MBE9128469.1 urease accessory protein UreD [Coleofasciculus sp. LEGE 07081]MBE9149272.1 urease accessory protein UreD [Coleofasciculus sp. LEGE 07092]
MLNPQPARLTPDETGWHGSLELVYRHHQGVTQLVRNSVRSPLKVQRPFYPEGQGVCHTVVLHTAGGMVGGDRLSQTIHLQTNARALITTAAASKLYRSNGQPAKQTIHIQVDAGACLEWLPQETIVFNGAVYQQDLRVELAPGASWLGWEITRFGRTARNERFLQGNWRSHTQVWQQGYPLWIDRQWLPGGEEILNSPHGLAGQPIVASLIWIGQPVSSAIVEKARTIWTATERQGEADVTQTQEEGLVCRYRGSSTAEVRNWFVGVWQLLRFAYFGCTATKPRVWLM